MHTNPHVHVHIPVCISTDIHANRGYTYFTRTYINAHQHTYIHSSDYWTVYTFVASQSLHNTQISKTKNPAKQKTAQFLPFCYLLCKRAKPAPPPYLLPLIVQHPLANCRLYYSQVTVDPQKSIDHVQRNRNKKVIYRSFVSTVILI